MNTSLNRARAAAAKDAVDASTPPTTPSNTGTVGEVDPAATASTASTTSTESVPIDQSDINFGALICVMVTGSELKAGDIATHCDRYYIMVASGSPALTPLSAATAALLKLPEPPRVSTAPLRVSPVLDYPVVRRIADFSQAELTAILSDAGEGTENLVNANTDTSNSGYLGSPK